MARVLVIGDTHCPAMRDDYVPFLKEVYKRHKCDTVVHIGDLVDNHACSYHEAESKAKSADYERADAQKQVDTLMHAFPNAKRRHLMIGNHDALPDRKARTAGLPSDYGKSFKNYWGLKGWTIHPRYSELKIDGVIYAHGEGPGGQYAHVRRCLSRCRSYVMGHWHGNGGVEFLANDEYRMFGLAVGTGVDNDNLQLAYNKPFPRKPINSCAVVIDGVRPIFEPMLLRTR
jgi:predicted phosphodiesterase